MLNQVRLAASPHNRFIDHRICLDCKIVSCTQTRSQLGDDLLDSLVVVFDLNGAALTKSLGCQLKEISLLEKIA
jgi:hypothetical protein